MLPAVPGLPLVAGVQAAAKIAKQSPKSDTRAVFIANLSIANRSYYLPTNVVTVVPASTALKLPLLTGTAAVATRFWVADVTVGVIIAGAVPPVIESAP